MLAAFPALGGVSHSAARASWTGRKAPNTQPQQSGGRVTQGTKPIGGAEPGVYGARAAVHVRPEPPGGGLDLACGEVALGSRQAHGRIFLTAAP